MEDILVDSNVAREVTTLQMVAILRRKFPDIRGIKSSSADCIFLGNCAEGGTINGMDACNYYVDDYSEEIYVMGVHKELNKTLDKYGWYVEWCDPGTCKAYRI